MTPTPAFPGNPATPFATPGSLPPDTRAGTGLAAPETGEAQDGRSAGVDHQLALLGSALMLGGSLWLFWQSRRKKL